MVGGASKRVVSIQGQQRRTGPSPPLDDILKIRVIDL